MELQEWFNENMPADELIYGKGMISQVIWMRDTFAYMIYNALADRYPKMITYENRHNHVLVNNTHTSKSCTMPVYSYEFGDTKVHVRGNFHDWCVTMDGITITDTDEIPEYMCGSIGKGYYEGMGDETSHDLHFCCHTREQMYAIVWWILANRIKE